MCATQRSRLDTSARHEAARKPLSSANVPERTPGGPRRARTDDLRIERAISVCAVVRILLISCVIDSQRLARRGAGSRARADSLRTDQGHGHAAEAAVSLIVFVVVGSLAIRRRRPATPEPGRIRRSHLSGRSAEGADRSDPLWSGTASLDSPATTTGCDGCGHHSGFRHGRGAGCDGLGHDRGFRYRMADDTDSSYACSS